MRYVLATLVYSLETTSNSRNNPRVCYLAVQFYYYRYFPMKVMSIYISSQDTFKEKHRLFHFKFI